MTYQTAISINKHVSQQNMVKLTMYVDQKAVELCWHF